MTKHLQFLNNNLKKLSAISFSASALWAFLKLTNMNTKYTQYKKMSKQFYLILLSELTILDSGNPKA